MRKVHEISYCYTVQLCRCETCGFCIIFTSFIHHLPIDWSEIFYYEFSHLHADQFMQTHDSDFLLPAKILILITLEHKKKSETHPKIDRYFLKRKYFFNHVPRPKPNRKWRVQTFNMINIKFRRLYFID
jgi:hypothetical protein